jgi:hypothetical protein
MPTATPERYSTSRHGTPTKTPGSLLGQFNEMSSKPSATVSVPGNAVGVKSRGVPVSELLSGVGPPKTVTSGVTVVGELTRLCEAKAFCVGEPPKSILFDPNTKHFVGIPPGFPEKKRYMDAMICVAMAITSKQWKALQSQDFNGQDQRSELFEIQKNTMSKVRELEIQWGVRMNGGRKDRSKPGMNSLGIRFGAIRKKMKVLRTY